LAALPLLLAIVFPLPALAEDYAQFDSRAYVVVDTALADGSDAAEIELMLFDRNSSGGFLTGPVYGASSRKEDSVSVSGGQAGLFKVTITSSKPGVSWVAFSLTSQDAAAQFLRGEIGAVPGRIIQGAAGRDIFPLYFIAGSLNAEFCVMEFDKDTIAVTGDGISDNAIGTISLRTEIDQPVANKRVRISSDKPGLTLYPTVSAPGQETGASTVITTNAQGQASFVVRAAELGDFEITASVDGQQFGEFIFVDLPENVFDMTTDDYGADPEEEYEEEKPEISRAHTRVSLSKPKGLEYGNNFRYNLPTTEDGWDKLIISGVAMSEDDQPVRKEHLVSAYATAGSLDKSTTLTTSDGGAFAFRLASKDICLGRYAVGLGTPEQLKGYLDGTVSEEACGLLGSGMYVFGARNWGEYLLCAIGDENAIANDQNIEVDIPPFIQQGRTMLTARPLADTLNALTRWDQASRTATFIYNQTETSMSAGSPIILQRERSDPVKQYTSDVPAGLREGRIVLPLRALATAFGMETMYDADQRLICIYRVTIIYPPAYDPRKDPSSSEYQPARDPYNPAYNPQLDPTSPEYDPTKDPESSEYVSPR
jgi:hypothetical protein